MVYKQVSNVKNAHLVLTVLNKEFRPQMVCAIQVSIALVEPLCPTRQMEQRETSALLEVSANTDQRRSHPVPQVHLTQITRVKIDKIVSHAHLENIAQVALVALQRETALPVIIAHLNPQFKTKFQLILVITHLLENQPKLFAPWEHIILLPLKKYVPLVELVSSVMKRACQMKSTIALKDSSVFREAQRE